MITIKEEWKDIKNYEGLYQVSNLGKVKSLERAKSNGRGLVKTEEVCRIAGATNGS